MPYVDFVSGSDRVSLWYITNTENGNASSFDLSLPTIIMLHPLFLDSTWLSMQMEDPRLGSKYNIIAFDARASGKSSCTLSGAHDSWVEAADLAFAVQALQLPPAHIFAIESLSINAALRFAALFPEMCLSLILVNVPPPTELEWVFEAYGEMLRLWCYPVDLDEFEHACMELSNMMLGKGCDTDLQDEVIAYWAMNWPPWKRSRIYETMHCLLNRTPLNDRTLAAITQPTFIIQAEKTEINPRRFADELAEALVNAKGGARVQTIKGSPEYATVVPTCASIVNRFVAEFLSRQPHFPTSVHTPLSTPIPQRMEKALAKLSELIGDDSIKTRNPRSPLSFSCVTPDVLKSQTEELRKCLKNECMAFSPLGHDGRPMRKFSERYKDHWFKAERGGITCAVRPLILTDKNKSKSKIRLAADAAESPSLSNSTGYGSEEDTLVEHFLIKDPGPIIPIPNVIYEKEKGGKKSRDRRPTAARPIIATATVTVEKTITTTTVAQAFVSATVAQVR